MMSEVFWSLVLSSSIGCFLAVVRMLYKSKCRNIKFCGIVIERDVAMEEKEFEFDRIHPNAPKESKDDI